MVLLLLLLLTVGGLCGLVNLSCDALGERLCVLPAIVVGWHIIVPVGAHGLRARHLVGAGVLAGGTLRRTLGHASIVRRISWLLHLIHYRSHILSLSLHMRWDAVRTHLPLRTSTILTVHYPWRFLPHPCNLVLRRLTLCLLPVLRCHFSGRLRRKYLVIDEILTLKEGLQLLLQELALLQQLADTLGAQLPTLQYPRVLLLQLPVLLLQLVVLYGDRLCGLLFSFFFSLGHVIFDNEILDEGYTESG